MAFADQTSPEQRDSAVGRHEQRQDVEALETFVCLEPRIVPGGVLDQGQGLRAVPRMTVYAGTRPSEPRVPESQTRWWRRVSPVSMAVRRLPSRANAKAGAMAGGKAV